MSDANEHVSELVDDYLHDLLPADRAAHVERHSAACPACKAALEEARQRLAALLAMPPCEASGQLLEAALHGIAEHERRRRRWRRRVLATAGGLVAATVLVLGGLHLYYSNLKPTPYDLIVLGQRDLLASTNAALRVRLLDRRNDKPLAGVPVTVELRGPAGVAELASFVTDSLGAGQPRFRLPDWADGTYELRVVARTPDGPEEVTRPVRLTRSWKLMLTSDSDQPEETFQVLFLQEAHRGGDAGDDKPPDGQMGAEPAADEPDE